MYKGYIMQCLCNVIETSFLFFIELFLFQKMSYKWHFVKELTENEQNQYDFPALWPKSSPMS